MFHEIVLLVLKGYQSIELSLCLSDELGFIVIDISNETGNTLVAMSGSK
jgi:hypothetical protein